MKAFLLFLVCLGVATAVVVAHPPAAPATIAAFIAGGVFGRTWSEVNRGRAEAASAWDRRKTGRRS